MHTFFVPELDQHHLAADEAVHATRVLRLRPGDAIALSNGRGTWAEAEITQATAKVCTYRIIRAHEIPRPKHHLHIAIAATKNHDRLEWFVEKATEIGIQEISFLRTDKTERKHIHYERLEKVAIAAMKQSQQAWLPVLHRLRVLADVLPESGQRFIAHVDFNNPVLLSRVALPHQRYVVLIGPEGDFSEAELEAAATHGYQKVSLGQNRLRTETAALMACAVLNEKNHT